MGCDFDIRIQTLYGNTWVTIVWFGTKTRCGGYPLTEAPRKLYKEKLIHGDYHVNDPVINTVAGAYQVMGFGEKRKQDKPSTSTPAAKVEEEMEVSPNERKEESVNLVLGKENQGNEAEEEDAYQPAFLYYSLEQFQDLLHYIDPLKDDRHNAYLYNRTMEPVPRWMEMAKTALPLEGGEIWMADDPEEIAETTEALKRKQKEVEELYTSMLLNLLEPWGRIPAHVLPIIASYARPKADDVRIAWADDEDQCNDLRHAQSPSDVPEGFVPPPCPIM